MPLATAAQAAARLLQMRLEFGAIFAMVNTGRACAIVRRRAAAERTYGPIEPPQVLPFGNKLLPVDRVEVSNVSLDTGGRVG
jgi:hypothetical protein